MGVSTMKRRNGRIRISYIFILCLLMAGLSACGETTGENEEAVQTSGFIPARAGMYDCADTAVIVAKSTKDKTLTLYNLVRKRNYTLEYDGTSKLTDKYGGSMSMEQIKEGDIVDITFLKSKKKLNSLMLSSQSWALNDISKFEIRERKKEITVADSIYDYDDNLFIFSNGKDAQIMDINQTDRLKIQGIGHTVYSIAVDKGHGYLRLKNDEYFIGGWIEVGQSVIRTIAQDMLLTVPEGSYDVLVSNGGTTGSKQVTINRDEETELDIGDLKGEDIVKYGKLLFALTPDDASLFIDGEEADTSQPVTAEYGIHQMMAKADGYQTVIQYIKVGQENATIQVTMEKETGKIEAEDAILATPAVPAVATPAPSVTPVVSTSGYKVTIDAPTGAEVYLDGNYVGIAPVSFTKVAGIHVVTLRKTGYSTRSYTIEADDTAKDQSFSFSELTAIE